MGVELALGADLGRPFKYAGVVSLLAGEHGCGDFPMFCGLGGVLIEARAGAAGASLAIGLAATVERRLMALGLLATATRTWNDADPWGARAGSTYYGGEGHLSLFAGNVFVGLARCACGGAADLRATVGVGFRLTLLSPYDPWWSELW